MKVEKKLVHPVEHFAPHLRNSTEPKAPAGRLQYPVKETDTGIVDMPVGANAGMSLGDTLGLGDGAKAPAAGGVSAAGAGGMTGVSAVG